MLKRTEERINQMISTRMQSNNFLYVKYQALFSLIISYKEQAQISLSIALVAIFSIMVFQGTMLVAIIDKLFTTASLCMSSFAAISSIIGIVTALIGASIFRDHKNQISICCEALSKIGDTLKEPSANQVIEESFLNKIYKPLVASLMAWAGLFVLLLLLWVAYIVFTLEK